MKVETRLTLGSFGYHLQNLAWKNPNTSSNRKEQVDMGGGVDGFDGGEPKKILESRCVVWEEWAEHLAELTLIEGNCVKTTLLRMFSDCLKKILLFFLRIKQLDSIHQKRPAKKSENIMWSECLENTYAHVC